jgi:hypothetical protein
MENKPSCPHDWDHVFGLNGRPHAIRVYNCKKCGAEKTIKTPVSKNGSYGKAKVTIK